MRTTATAIRAIVQKHLEITTWRPHNKQIPSYIFDPMIDRPGGGKGGYVRGTPSKRCAKFYVLPSERNNTAGMRDALNAIVNVIECRLYKTWAFDRTHKSRVWRLSVVYTPQ